MNEHETIDLLIRRRETVGTPYGQQTITYWADALHELDYADVLAAFDKLIAEGENNITVPALRKRLIATRQPADDYTPPEAVAQLPPGRIAELLAAGIAEGRRQQAQHEANDPVFAERMRHFRRVEGKIS